MVLRESLLDLLETMPISQISITELCKGADVNRNTFYNHYNTPGEILTDLETEVHDNLMKAVNNIEDIEAIILVACKTLESEKKLSKIIFSETDASKILSKIVLSFKDVKFTDMSIYDSKGDKLLTDIVYLYGEKGAIAVIKEWVLGGFEEPAELIAKHLSFLQSKLDDAVKSYSE